MRDAVTRGAWQRRAWRKNYNSSYGLCVTIPDMPTLRRFVTDPQGNHSLHHSIYDGMAYSVMVGCGESYFSAFALFLRATASQVALISTLPPLLGSIAQLISVWINRRIKVCKPIIIAGVTLQAGIWLPLIALLIARPDNAWLPLVVLLIFYYGASHLATPAWTRLMGDLVPERRRGRYFAYRNRVTSLINLVSMIAAGIILDVFDRTGSTVIGFTAIFSIAFVARMISVRHIRRMHEPQLHATTLENPGIVFNTVRHGGAGIFTLYFVCMQMAVAVASPLFTVYMLRDLRFSYVEFMANMGAAVAIQFVTLNLWGRIGDIFGHRLILLLTGVGIPLLPLLWVVSGNFWYLLAVQAFSGLVWGGFNLACGNLLFDLVPAAQRVSYVAVHNVLYASGVFLGALLGMALIDMIPARAAWFGATVMTPLLNVFLISTLLRFLVSLLFLGRIREHRKVRRPRLSSALIFRLTRYNAFMGAVYDFVTETKVDRGGENE
ncbi:MAG: MFS transporter [Gammaproteobacteria bacterium]|nr:MAG: MFS transporter [Gammaproteobacteria bacterium]